MSKLWFPTGLLVWLTYPAVHCDPFTVNEWCLLWYFSRESPPQDLEQRERAFLSPACRGEGVGRRREEKRRNGDKQMAEWNGEKGKGGQKYRLWSQMMKISESRCCFSLQGGSKQKASMHHWGERCERNQWRTETRWMQGTNEVFFQWPRLNKVAPKLLNPGTPNGDAAAFSTHLRKHPRLSSGGCSSWEGTVTFLIQPAAPFNSAATYVSQHVHLHLRTQFKITLLNNVNDSLPPDLFSLGIRHQHWGGEFVWLLHCNYTQGGVVPPSLTTQTKHCVCFLISLWGLKHQRWGHGLR